MDSEEGGFVEWAEIGEGLRSELCARSSMEYCTHLEVEHFESEGMRQPMEVRCWGSFLRKVTERRESRAARVDLVRAVAVYLEGA